MAIDIKSLDPEQRAYAKMVGDEAVAHNIDPDLAIAQAFQESGLRHFVQGEDNQWKPITSNQKAVGIMQITPDAADTYGIPREDLIDPTANIRGGMKIMRSHLDKYKEPDLAILAYHQGPGAVDKYLETGDLNSFGPNGKDYLKRIGQNYDFTGTRISDAPPEAQTEAEKILAEKQPWKKEENPDEVDRTKAFMYGAGTGAVIGATERALGVPEKPVTADVAGANSKYEVAQERLKIAKERLAEHNEKSTSSIEELKKQLSERQAELNKAESDLNEARQAYREQYPTQAKTEKASSSVPTEAQNERIIQGGVDEEGTTGRARQQGYNESTSWQKANKVEQEKIAQDLARKGLIEGKSPLTKIAAPTSTPAGVIIGRNVVYEQELAQKIADAKTAPERQALQEELQRLQTTHAEAKKSSVETAKRLAQEETSASSKARSLLGKVESAEDAARLAQFESNAKAKLGSKWLDKIGHGVSKIMGNTVVAGGLTGLSVADAINEYKKGNYSQAVLDTIEAAFGTLAMAPDARLRGIGVVGGLSATAGDIAGNALYKSLHPESKVEEQKPLDFKPYIDKVVPKKAKGGSVMPMSLKHVYFHRKKRNG